MYFLNIGPACNNNYYVTIIIHLHYCIIRVIRITSNIINIVDMGEGDKAKMAEMAEMAETDNNHHICDEQNPI